MIRFHAKFFSVFGLVITLLVTAGSALAVTPAVWQFHSEADFVKCERESTVVNSHGDVTLARKIEIILASASAPAVVSAVAVDGETIYAASGTDGWIYKIVKNIKKTKTKKPPKKSKKDQADKKSDKESEFKAEKFAKLPSAMVTCLVRKGKTLLAGGGGSEGGIYAIDPAGKVKKVFAEDVVKYVWAITPGPKGLLYAATGPEGIVYSIDESGKGEVLYHIDKKLAKNILCLSLRDDGKLLAGTDQSGLVIEIDPATRVGRVILDAAEKEISAIVTDGDGGLFVATSDTTKAGSPAAAKPTDSKNGKAESQPVKKTADKSAEKPEEKIAPPPATQPAEKKEKHSAKTSDKAQSPKLKLIGLPNDQAARPAWESVVKSRKTPSKSAGKVLNKGKSVVKPQKPSAKSAGKVFNKKNFVIEAKNNGKKNSKSTSAAKMPSAIKAAMVAAMKSKRSTTHKRSGKGNAVYHIDSRGMVRTIFRKKVTIHAMLAQGDRLILATGNEGKVYYVTKDGTLSGELVDTDAKQVTAMVETPAGELVFATSNKGSLGRIGNSFAASGTIINKPADAKQIAQWGTIKLRGVAPENTTITIATRSGNLAEADDSTWSSWSKEMPLETGYLPIGSPAARFLQYRVTFTSKGTVTPSLGSVQAIYQVGNLAPAVLGVTVRASSKGAKPTQKAMNKAYRIVAIQALDPNGDKMQYTIDFQLIGTGGWVEITDSLKTPKYVWDTRTVADGIYELRVTASDSPSNIPAATHKASRVSEPVIVDNTSPTLEELTAKVNGDKALVQGKAIDAMSRIVTMQYSVDSVEKWKTILPIDGICDSPAEAFSFEADELKPGPHRISIKATDVFGNTGYGGVNVTVKNK